MLAFRDSSASGKHKSSSKVPIRPTRLFDLKETENNWALTPQTRFLTGGKGPKISMDFAGPRC
jgi:hypothetical protein